MNRRNIHDDPEAAEIVRSIADGNETVPTVIVGTVALVNPTTALVKATVEKHAPHLVREDSA